MPGTKPKGRGRFSRERDVWDTIHAERLQGWIEGASIEDIAQVHGISCRAVHLSLARSLARLHWSVRRRMIQERVANREMWKARLEALNQFWIVMNPSIICNRDQPLLGSQVWDKFQEALNRVAAAHGIIGRC